jgi:hypothetical protein
MRAALRHVRSDKSFEPTHEDDTFRRLDELVPVGVDFVIAGHTHLRRSHPRSSGGRYINTGTWARLIRLDHAILASPSLFAQFYEALQEPSMEALDLKKMHNGESVVIHLPSVAHVERHADRVTATLYAVAAAPTSASAPEGAGAAAESSAPRIELREVVP